MDVTKYFPHHMYVTKYWRAPIAFLRDEYHNIRAYFQRGRKGWAISDVWNMDNYLGKILPAMLRYLADHHMGYPMAYHEEYPGDDEGASIAWATDLKRIADLIEYANTDSDEYNQYAKEYWDIAFKKGPNDPMPPEKQWLQDAYYQESATIHKKQQAAIKEAFEWLGDKFYCLWD